MEKEVLGVDVGGVIIDRVNDGTDTSFFTDNYLNTTAVPGAFDVLRELVDDRFGENVFIVSTCGENIQRKTIHWFNHHRFHQRTGILRSHVHYCRERREKAGICERLGITHFIDDRLEILGSLKAVGGLYLFRGRDSEVKQYTQHLHRVRPIASWQEVEKELLS